MRTLIDSSVILATVRRESKHRIYGGTQRLDAFMILRYRSAMRFPHVVALRYLWCKRTESFISIITIISVLGVAVGVMVLTIVMAVMTGFEFELREKILGTNAHVVVRSIGGAIGRYEERSQILSTLPGVVSVTPFTYHQALVRAPTGASGIILKGIAPKSAAALSLQGFLANGQSIDRLFDPPSVEVRNEGTLELVRLPGIVIGQELAKTHGLAVGDAVSLLSPQVSSTPFGLVPKFKRFVVAAVYSSGLVEYESGLAYVAIGEAQQFFRMGQTASGIELRVKDVYRSKDISAKALEALGGLSSGLYVQDWSEVNRPLWDAIRLERTVYFVVLLLIVVIASFSIVSTLVMIVMEKRRDIAVLMTLGATGKSVRAIFQIQGSVIGVVGTTLGLILGYAGCVALREYGFPLDQRVFPLSTLPVRMDPVHFAIVGVSALFICAIATIYPARKASRISPTELLRSE